VMHATEIDTPNLDVVLPKGFKLEKVKLDEPLIIAPFGDKEDCYFNIVGDHLGQGFPLSKMLGKMNKKEITKKVKVVLENYGLEEKQLTSNASFMKDLGFDSLDFAELILTIEQEFDLSIYLDQVKLPINTIHDLVTTLNEVLNANTLKSSS